MINIADQEIDLEIGLVPLDHELIATTILSKGIDLMSEVINVTIAISKEVLRSGSMLDRRDNSISDTKESRNSIGR